MRIKYSHRKITMTHTQTTCPNRIAFRASKKGARLAEVGAMAPVFEKSATELKLKQKLLKCKSSTQRATFNVRTLNRIGCCGADKRVDPANEFSFNACE